MIVDIDKLGKVLSGLNSLKTRVEKIDIGKLETTLVDFKKLSDVGDKDVVKKTVNDELVKQVNAIDPNELVKKANYNAKIHKLECKIHSITRLTTNVVVNANIIKVKCEVSGLATTAAFTAAENKHGVSDIDEKQLIMKTYETLRVNISRHLITIILPEK